jgi:hypothetical protein
VGPAGDRDELTPRHGPIGYRPVRAVAMNDGELTRLPRADRDRYRPLRAVATSDLMPLARLRVVSA